MKKAVVAALSANGIFEQVSKNAVVKIGGKGATQKIVPALHWKVKEEEGKNYYEREKLKFVRIRS